MIRAIIVDDEPLAREVLREFLAADEELEVVAECANGFEAVRAVTQHDPDVLFLDIQMPKLDGFEVLELLDRIHRSYLLNIERIEKIELYAKDSRVAILRDGTKLPVSRAGYARLRELL